MNHVNPNPSKKHVYHAKSCRINIYFVRVIPTHWHSILHFFGHSIWQTFWHPIRHFIWHMFWHLSGMMFSIYSGISDGIYCDIHNVAVQVQRSLHPVLWGTGIQACPTASLDHDEMAEEETKRRSRRRRRERRRRVAPLPKSTNPELVGGQWVTMKIKTVKGTRWSPNRGTPDFLLGRQPADPAN